MCTVERRRLSEPMISSLFLPAVSHPVLDICNNAADCVLCDRDVLASRV